MRIVIAEDQEMGRMILAEHLRQWGHEVIETCNGKEALDFIVQNYDTIDILITDWSMPVMDGVELAQRVRQLHGSHYIYIILLTARSSLDDKLAGFSQGGVDDYIIKPFKSDELHLRLQVGQRVISAEQIQRTLNKNLQRLVEEQSAVLTETQEEIISRLFNAVETRDGETGGHVNRIAYMSACMSTLLGWTDEDTLCIKNAARLHDIGKIAIPDAILCKPDRLTSEEFEIIKQHAAIGASLLSNSHIPSIRMGEVIAHHHHENWDGSGYPCGLVGENIPIEARITAIVDVYDALKSDRVYRPGMPEELVIKILLEGNGTKFDPYLLHLFLENLQYIKSYTQKHMS